MKNFFVCAYQLILTSYLCKLEKLHFELVAILFCCDRMPKNETMMSLFSDKIGLFGGLSSKIWKVCKIYVKTQDLCYVYFNIFAPMLNLYMLQSFSVQKMLNLFWKRNFWAFKGSKFEKKPCFLNSGNFSSANFIYYRASFLSFIVFAVENIRA